MAPAEQKAQKAFELRDARDMLEKLQWELNNLFSRQRHDIKVCRYHAFNCAVTAWHVTDWLWEEISSSPELRARVHDRIGIPVNNCKDFQRYVRNDCRALKLCHQIANGSKHCKVTHKPDPTISALISDGEGYDYGNPIIVDGDAHYQADMVFHEALCWFRIFLDDVLPEEPFVPFS